LLTFLRFPAGHCWHLRTTNVIESVFAPAKVRTKRAKGAAFRAAGLAIGFKLVSSARGRWHQIRTPDWVRLVREGVRLRDRKIVPSRGPGVPLPEPEGLAACST